MEAFPIFMTIEQKPFFTYLFQPVNHSYFQNYGMCGFIILVNVSNGVEYARMLARGSVGASLTLLNPHHQRHTPQRPAQQTHQTPSHWNNFNI